MQYCCVTVTGLERALYLNPPRYKFPIYNLLHTTVKVAEKNILGVCYLQI